MSHFLGSTTAVDSTIEFLSNNRVDSIKELIYSGCHSQFLEKFEHLDDNEKCQLLHHDSSKCRYNGQLSIDGPATVNELELTTFFEILLTQNVQIVCTVMDFIELHSLEAACRCGCYQLIDICCTKDGGVDEEKLANFLLELGNERPKFCANLMRTEATEDLLRPVEYASLRKKFYLARAMLELPEFIVTKSVMAKDRRLAQEQMELTEYRFTDGERLFKSPFVTFGLLVSNMLHSPIPPGFVHFYNSRITQAYMDSVSQYEAGLLSLAIFASVYLFVFLSTLLTLSTKIFTRGTFNPAIKVRVGGLENTTYLLVYQLPESAFSFLYHLNYLRIIGQVLLLIISIFTIALLWHENRVVPSPVRCGNFVKSLLLNAVFLLPNPNIGVIVDLTVVQLALLLFEAFGISYPPVGDGEFELPEATFTVLVSLLFLFVLFMLLFFIGHSGGHLAWFFVMLHSLHKALSIVYIISFPIILYANIIILFLPAVQASSVINGWTLAIFETLNFVFTFGRHPGTSSQVLLASQSMAFLFVVIFIANYCIAELSSQVDVLQQHLEFRFRVKRLYFMHSYCLLYKNLCSGCKAQTRAKWRLALVRIRAVAD